jgi:hypothetical protein
MKKIVMSDLHLGQDGFDGSGSYSLLSSIPGHMVKERALADIKMTKLKSRVTSFADGSPIILICCGDVLDLSFAYFSQTYQDLVRLLNNLPEVERLVFIAGNHDHHIWTMHCEQTSLINPLINDGRPWGGGIYIPTPRAGEIFELFEKSLRKSLGKSIAVDIAYPSYSIDIQNHTFYFTHGHLFGGLYNLISRILSMFLKEDINEKQAATLNVALIEFIYWLWGETGEGMGANGIIEALHVDSRKGKDSLIKQIINKGIDEIIPGGIIKGIPDAWERKFVKWAIGKFVDKILKDKPQVVVSRDRHEDPEQTKERVKDWIDNMLKHIPRRSLDGTEKTLTFVSGHTHRSGSAAIGDNTKIYNLGSWLVEPNNDNPDTEVLMIDEDGKTLMQRI